MDNNNMNIVRSRRTSREENSPDRTKLTMQIQPNKPIKKVHVVYYLSRNGHLEHPHYMEVTHFPNHPLRLRDVMDRLTVLRGKGMPSLYSWSCKRSYKNGYVWNDLGENDVIYPSDGSEYVLKGSELLVQGSQQLPNNRKQLIPIPIPSPNRPNKQLNETRTSTNKLEFEEEYKEEESESQEEEEYEEISSDQKTSSSTTTTPHSRCSRGVSTDEHPITDSSSLINTTTTSNASKRFEDGDPVVSESSGTTTRNSVLLQLISCGNLAAARPPKNNGASLKQQGPKKRENYNVNQNLQRKVLYKSAIKIGEEEEDVINIKYMSENPRFGNLQAEEKEYFSGSIVDSIRDNNRVAELDQSAGLKRSNSYNEERRRQKEKEKEAILMEEEEKEEKKEKGVRGKCIPRKVLSSKQNKK